MLAIIGGSGFSRLPELESTRREAFRTAYGEPSCPLLFGKLGGRDIVFLARHGFGHTFAPHEINYRANIDALKQAGADKILSLSAVASMDETLTPGDLVLPHDLIDYTSMREHTFFSGVHMPVVHPDFSAPYDADLRRDIETWAENAQVSLHRQAVYACLQGPRLPTRAEVCRYRHDGGNVYGMTGMPEAVLAQEKDMAYVHLCGIIGMAAGCGGNGHAPQFKSESDSAASEKIRRILRQIA
ncbi:MAG: S-methyl-5'-thioinosine phosphorylase [Neisseria sp.]|nr:S-methyl-5'-thioinosine phosphorylase [Neisseria sp.]